MTGERVRLSKLSKAYGKDLVVRDVDLDVPAGSFFTLLGPSGSGKSTTLMMIAGFATPSSGSIHVGETDITALVPQKRSMGVVFQNYALFPHMTVAENVGFPLRMRRMPREQMRERIAQTIRLVKLEGLEERTPRQLSGGQQQRVALARALAFNPGVLLMDEPLSALDKSLRSHMQHELKRLQEELGVTVVYVTHDQEEALSMSDQLAVMNDGLVAQSGTPSELYEHPASRFVAGFLGDTNFLPARLVARTGEAASVECDFGPIMTRTTSHDRSARLVAAFRPERVVLADGPIDGFNGCAGTVLRTTFTGDTVRYVVEVGRGATIVAKAQNGPSGEQWTPGQRVHACWRPQDTSLHAEA